MGRIFLENAHPGFSIKKKDFCKLAVNVLKKNKIGYKSLNIIFTNDSYITLLNKKFLKKNRPTDVLAFDFKEKDFLGEIYISLDRAKRQAKMMGHGFYREIRRLVVHGIVHLLGYEHKTKHEELKMYKKEKLYL